MKKILLVLASFLLAQTGIPQTVANKPVQCGNFAQVAQMAEQYGEVPILRGFASIYNGQQVVRGRLIMSYNKDTKSYTIIEVYNDQVACVIAAGTHLEFLVFENSDNKTLDIDPRDSVEL